MSRAPTPIPDHYAPVREVMRTHGSISGVFMFHGTPVKFESSLEKDFLIRLSTINSVHSVISQPLSVKFKAQNNREYNYTPDFLVHYKNDSDTYMKSELIEIKPHFKLKKELSKLKLKFKSAMSCCKELDFIFHIKDEKKIRDKRWENAQFLRRYQRFHFDSDETKWIITKLSDSKEMTFEALLKEYPTEKKNRSIGISQLWYLVSKNIVSCDYSEKFSVKTILWLNNEKQ